PKQVDYFGPIRGQGPRHDRHAGGGDHRQSFGARHFSPAVDASCAAVNPEPIDKVMANEHVVRRYVHSIDGLHDVRFHSSSAQRSSHVPVQIARRAVIEAVLQQDSHGRATCLTDIFILTAELLPQGYPPGFSRPGALPADPRRPVCALLGPSTLGMAALAADFSDTTPTSDTGPTVGQQRRRCYPAGTDSAASRRTIAPNSRRVKCPSASSSQ